MTLTFKTLGWVALWSAAGIAAAQEPPAPAAAASTAAAPATPVPATTVTKPANTTAQAEAGEPRANTSPVTPGASATPAAARPHTAPKSASTVDRLDLGTATVTGDREQPKVMYIVPWKRSDMGDLGGKPMNSLLDEVLAPVDRDVFKRQVIYYEAVTADPSQNGAPGPQPANQGEK